MRRSPRPTASGSPHTEACFADVHLRFQSRRRGYKRMRELSRLSFQGRSSCGFGDIEVGTGIIDERTSCYAAILAVQIACRDGATARTKAPATIKSEVHPPASIARDTRSACCSNKSASTPVLAKSTRSHPASSLPGISAAASGLCPRVRARPLSQGCSFAIHHGRSHCGPCALPCRRYAATARPRRRPLATRRLARPPAGSLGDRCR